MMASVVVMRSFIGHDRRCGGGTEVPRDVQEVGAADSASVPLPALGKLAIVTGDHGSPDVRKYRDK